MLGRGAHITRAQQILYAISTQCPWTSSLHAYSCIFFYFGCIVGTPSGLPGGGGHRMPAHGFFRCFISFPSGPTLCSSCVSVTGLSQEDNSVLSPGLINHAGDLGTLKIACGRAHVSPEPQTFPPSGDWRSCFMLRACGSNFISRRQSSLPIPNGPGSLAVLSPDCSCLSERAAPYSLICPPVSCLCPAA